MNKILFISIVMTITTQSCKTPNKIETYQEVTRTETLNEENDTVITVTDKIITVKPTAEGGTETHIKETGQTVTKKRSSIKRDHMGGLNLTTQDNITPILAKIERKRQNDSIKGKVAEAKQVTKRAKYSATKLVIYIICGLVLALLVSRLRTFLFKVKKN